MYKTMKYKNKKKKKKWKMKNEAEFDEMLYDFAQWFCSRLFVLVLPSTLYQFEWHSTS